MKFRLLRPAAVELRKAARYCEDRVPGLGFDFVQEVRAAIRRILTAPAYRGRTLGGTHSACQ